MRRAAVSSDPPPASRPNAHGRGPRRSPSGRSTVVRPKTANAGAPATLGAGGLAREVRDEPRADDERDAVGGDEQGEQAPHDGRTDGGEQEARSARGAGVAVMGAGMKSNGSRQTGQDTTKPTRQLMPTSSRALRSPSAAATPNVIAPPKNPSSGTPPNSRAMTGPRTRATAHPAPTTMRATSKPARSCPAAMSHTPWRPPARRRRGPRAARRTAWRASRHRRGPSGERPHPGEDTSKRRRPHRSGARRFQARRPLLGADVALANACKRVRIGCGRPHRKDRHS
jgi:hypothetical protein